MFPFLDDKCQYWLHWIHDSEAVLTTPYFDGRGQTYYNNLNCTWILKAEEGFFVNFEVRSDEFQVKNSS